MNMNVFLKPISATLGFGALLALAPAHAAATVNVPIQVFLVNLSPQAINSVSWTGSNGDAMTSGTVPSGGIIALGAMTVPEGQTGNIGISQTAANGSAINTSFTLSNMCGFEPFQSAQAGAYINPYLGTDMTPYYSYTALAYDYAKNEFNIGPNTFMICLSNNNQFSVSVYNVTEYEPPIKVGTSASWYADYTYYYYYPTAYSSNMQPVVLGSYVPTGFSWDTSTAPAFYNLGATSSAPGLTLSPTGLTTYMGTSVLVPYDSSNFSYWPVTIYYGVDGNGNPQIPLIPGAQLAAGQSYSGISGFSGTTTGQSNVAVEFSDSSWINYYSAVNIPAYFTNFQASGNESAYIPPNAGSVWVNDFAFPMPCWPLFNTSNEFVGCNGAPQYVSNNSAPTAQAKSVLQSMQGVIGTVDNLVDFVGIF